MSRLDVLSASLVKKEARLASLLDNHFDTVKSTNGQPMNDKRNGAAHFKKIEQQNDAIRKANAEIDKTKSAIERERLKISGVGLANETMPKPILDAILSNKITQWRKFPNRFFVVGVEKGRLIWEAKEGKLFAGYTASIPTAEQKETFKTVARELYAELKNGGLNK